MITRLRKGKKMKDNEKLVSIFLRNTAKDCIVKNADGTFNEESTIEKIIAVLRDFATEASGE